MDVQSDRSLPKNFRQIGSAEKSTKVYIEDYVYTFMKKLSDEKNISVGALIGNKSVREGTECVFISGMVKALDFHVSDSRVIITDNTWAAVFENVKKYFDKMTVCGWFISSDDVELCRLAAVSGIYNCSENDNSLVYIRNKDNDEDCVYKMTKQDKMLLSGYYIYYERNEQMQEYMIDTNGTRSVDPPPVNIMKRLDNSEKKETAKQVREDIKEIPEIEPDTAREKKTGRKTMYFAASFLLISFLALGYSIYLKSGRSTADIPVISDLTSVFRGSDKPQAAETMSQSGIIIETAGGIINESSAETEAVNQDISETVSETVPAAGETEPVIQETGPVQEQTAEAEAEPETAASVLPDTASGSSYIVQAGDTLTSICVKIYGKEDMSKIEEIRNRNGLESADYIFVGQVLTMP